LVQGFETLKLFGHSQRQEAAILQSAENFRQSTMASLRLAFMSGMVLELLASLSMAMIAVAVGIRLLGGHIAFEPAIFLLILIPDFYGPWRALGAKFHDGLNGLSAARTIYAWLDRPPLARGQGRRMLPGAGPWPIALSGVGFTYPGRAERALNNVHFSLKAREVLAVIGPSGSGKSTLLALLLGFADPTQGEILVASHPLAELDRRWWRSEVAYIGQSPYLFRGTIGDNLRMADPGADRSRIAWAIEQAHLDDTLKRFPQGLNTVIGENGLRLSGGERQRLALARAFLRARPFVVLDEPSAHLDQRTEHALLEGIRQLQSQSTVVLVTHRMATVNAADRVLVLENGEVADLGAPADLTHPFYQLARAYAKTSGAWEGEGYDAILAGTPTPV
jgi:ABC-type transport system involved in cytochrome bd biosynthesis fused ATPase/permease subunit